ncbi:hypothetical protein MITS9504_02986 [Synechococcus sp. MIT S9504]|nr:hypothetical protein MITS9504_02986 [Synechococcus sp. MIT S9504]
MVKRIDWIPELLESLPKTREDAIAEESRHCFPNIECKNGHITCWLVNGGCFFCKRERTKNVLREEGEQVMFHRKKKH